MGLGKWCAALALMGCAACAHTPPSAGEPTPQARGAAPSAASGVGVVPPPAVLAPHEGPTLFLSADDSSPAIGYTAPDLYVEPAEAPQGGRVLVHIDGALRVRAYVSRELLVNVVQRRGSLRGAPLYLGPGDRVHVVGPAKDDPSRVQVEARARIGAGWTDTYVGTYPAIGLALQPAPEDAEPPSPGTPYLLPPGVSLTLHDTPGGSVVAGLSASNEPVPVSVLRDTGEWRAVRVGHGPYLIGYTQDPIVPGKAPAVNPVEPVRSAGAVPERIEREAGALKRVKTGTKMRFNNTIIAVFKADGWARVLAEYPEGQVDVFAAADDQVAIRGLVDASALSDPE